MSIFEFLSDTDCTRTEEYMESFADHMEEVLKEDFGIAVKNEPSDPTEEILRLLAFSVLTLSPAKENPNVDDDCAAETGRVLKERLQEWTSAGQLEDTGNSFYESPLWRQGAKMIQEDANFAERQNRVLKYALKRWGDDSEVFVEIAGFSDAESIMLRSVNRHDQNQGYRDWISEAIALKEAELYAGEVANAVGSELNQEYQISPQKGKLSRNEEAVVGAFYLACLSHLPERGIHQNTSVLELRNKLAGSISNRTDLLRAEQYKSFADGSYRNTIISWAASHLEGKEFYPSEKRSHVPRNVTRFEKVVDEALGFAEEIEVDLS